MFCVWLGAGWGICAVSPSSLSIDTTTMKTMISVSSTSISGVTLISGPRAPPPAIENDIESSSPARARLQHQIPTAQREFPGSGWHKNAERYTSAWDDRSLQYSPLL